MKRFLVLAVVVLTACATQPTPVPAAAPAPAATSAVQCSPGHAILNATLWMQTAAEYRASAIQVYGNARRMLDAALADPNWTAEPMQTAPYASKPPAVILDLDETVLDNSAFEARAVLIGKTFDQKLWEEYVAEGSATAVPGAIEFLQYAKSRGVTPFYVTNRDPVEVEGTLRNLEKLGIPPAGDDMLLNRGKRPEWKSDKGPRRAWIAEKYRILLLVGDDLNDFANARDASAAQRYDIVAANAARWGTQWHMLPNAIYGSWERAAYGSVSSLPPCEQLQKRIDALKP